MPVLAEHTADPGIVRRYGIGQFPSIVWTDAEGEVVAVTVRPESSADAIRDLAVAREFLQGER